MSHQKKVLIGEEIIGSGIKRVQKNHQIQTDPDLWKNIPQLTKSLQGVHGMFIRNQTKIKAGLLFKADDPEIIGRTGAGFDHIGIQPAFRFVNFARPKK